MRALGTLFAVGLTVTTAFSPGARAATVPAAPADSLVEFIGVNAHLNWGQTIWTSGAAIWQARLGELGIRYVRTDIGTSTLARDMLATLNRNFGIRANVVVDYRRPGSLNITPVQATLNFLRDQVGVGKLVSIEGPNEYSSTKYDAGNGDWATDIRFYQQYLYSRVKADPQLRSLPVLAPTIYRRILADYQALGNLGAYADRGNLHYYNGARRPSLYPLETTYLRMSESTVDVAIQNAQITAPLKRIFVTETGYNMRLPLSSYFTPERAYAKYALRLLGEYFLRRSRVEKVFFYSLIDDLGQLDKYGLLRGTDLRPRPVFYAVKNLVRILSDRGPSFTPRALTYTLSGNLFGIDTIVLQKRDGRFYMLLWNDVDSYNRSTLQEMNPPPRQLALNVSQHRFSRLNIYDPTALAMPDPNRGSLPIQTVYSPSNVTLNVADRVMVVEMVP